MNKKYFDTRKDSLEDKINTIASEQASISKPQTDVKLSVEKKYFESKKGSLEDLASKLVESKLDPVNKDAAKKKFDDRKDKDIDNDGDVDSSDKFLHKRRKAISKATNEACWDSHKQVGFKMKGGKRVPNCVPKNEELEESRASDQAKSMGLTYLKFGRYGKNGKVTHKSDGGALRKFDPKTGKMGDKETKGTDDPKSLSSKETEQEVKKLKDKIGLYKKDGSPSAGKLKGIITHKIRSQSGAGDDLGFIEYSYPSSDTLEMDADEPDELVKVLKKRFGDALDIKTDYNIVTAKVKDFDDVKEDMQEADLTDKQVDMVKKVADKLPKDDFKKRYGKDADNVKFGTATNIVKKKLNIDGYEGARNLVDRLLKQEKGDE